MSYKYQLLLESKQYKNFETLVEASFPRLTATYIKAFFKNILKAYKEGVQTAELEAERIKKLNNYFNKITEFSKEHQNLKNLYSGEQLKLKEEEVLKKIDQLHKDFAIYDVGLTQEEVNQVIYNAKKSAVIDPQASIISDADIDRIHANSRAAEEATRRLAALKEDKAMNNKLMISEQYLKQVINEETYNFLAEAGFLDRFPGIANALKKLKSGETDRAALSSVNINNLFNEFLKMNNLLYTLNISTENLYKILNTINDPAIKTAARDLNTIYDVFSSAIKEFNYLIAEKFPDNDTAKQFLAKSNAEKLAFTQKSQQSISAAQTKYITKAFNRANELLTTQKTSGEIPRDLKLTLPDVTRVINYLMKTNQYKLVENVSTNNTEFNKLVDDIVKGAGVKKEIATTILNSLINLKAFGAKKISGSPDTVLDLPKLANLQDIKEHLKKRNNYQLLKSQLLN